MEVGNVRSSLSLLLLHEIGNVRSSAVLEEWSPRKYRLEKMAIARSCCDYKYTHRLGWLIFGVLESQLSATPPVPPRALCSDIDSINRRRPRFAVKRHSRFAPLAHKHL